jgi:integration host factor subunit beta
MTKADLVDRITEATGLTKRDVAVVVDRFIDAIGGALAAGKHIEIRGFGSFKVKFYNGYKGRNPKTGDIIEVGGKKLPFFKVGKELGELVDN